MPISETHKVNWKLELENHKNGKIGVWASFLQSIGLGADFSINYDHVDTSVYEFKRLDTYTFYPTNEYVKQSVMAPEVQAHLAGKKFHQNVYMITAISVAVGATVTNTTLRNRGVHTYLGLDGTAAGVPISVGPDVEVGKGRKDGVSFDGGSDFVFAFRLREIYYTTKRGPVSGEFTKGALYGLERGAEETAILSTAGNKPYLKIRGTVVDTIRATSKDAKIRSNNPDLDLFIMDCEKHRKDNPGLVVPIPRGPGWEPKTSETRLHPPTWAYRYYIPLQYPSGESDNDIANLMSYFCVGRQLIQTERGYFGLASTLAQVGDVVCCFLGGAVPFVLRKIEDHHKVTGNCYTFIGESCMYGLMNGEAIQKKQNIAPSKREDLYIF
ncbi:hypothetical protein MMC30_006583 [Trapelia coarctata]|nr:hypothetical protein [Trapelia coarctata]